MAATQTLTQKWLSKESGRYRGKDRVYADVDAALASYRSLKPKTDAYTYDDGRMQSLLCIHGLLPITFRGASYNIPIACWLPLEYPKAAPLAYVVPTADMLVRSSDDVEVSGLCKFEYLVKWPSKPEGCSIRGLLEVMQDHFSRQPPVYAKPKPRVSTNPPSSSPPTSLPASPNPQMVASPSVNPPPNPPGSYAPPPIPLKPPIGPFAPSASPSPSGQSVINGIMGGTPTRPPPPLPGAGNVPPGYISPDNQNYAPVPQDSRYGFFTPSRPPPPPPPSHPTYTPTPPATMSPPPPSSYAPSPPPPPPIGYPAQPQPPPPPIIPVASPPPPVARPVIPDLLGGDDESLVPGGSPNVQPEPVAAPPRPPNPHVMALHNEIHARITAQMALVTKAMTEDTDRLRAIQADLLAGEPAIRDEMGRLGAVRDVCRAVADKTREWVTQVEAAVTETKRRGEPEVDELVCSTTIVYNQLIELVAEDNAIEDTMYHLHRALNAGRIDLDRFTKTMRELAEEQFMKRALIEKIEAGMPVGTRGRWM
ncbi:UEV-domain-containing protein [Clavulina sp. PMI_390]|nr:UEV-domain-containing protein [Clavulina sp. PMI_390]